MKFIVLSYYGFQKRQIASNRVLGICKALSENENNIEILFISWNFDHYPTSELNDFSFVKDKIFINTYKGRIVTFIRNLIISNKNFNVFPSSANKNQSRYVIKDTIIKILNNIKGKIFLPNFNLVFDNIDNYYIKISANKSIKFLAKSNLLKKYISNEKVFLLTSAGPAVIHEIGYKLKKRYSNIFWIADYRDPLEFVDSLNFKTSHSLQIIDKLTFKNSDLITSVSNGLTKQLINTANLYNIDIKDKCYTLYNGILNEDFYSNNGFNDQIIKDDRIKIIYTGHIYPFRKIDFLVKILSKNEFKEKFVLIYAGSSYKFFDEVVNYYSAEKNTINLGYISKDKSFKLQQEGDILLLLKSPDKEEGGFTGKFFEYLQAKKRILVLGEKDEEFNNVCYKLGCIDILPYEENSINKYLHKIQRTTVKCERNDELIKDFYWSNLIKDFLSHISHIFDQK